MTIAFTFPGQGSQKPGMGRPWVDHESWELVDEASDAAGRDVARLLLDADAEELTETRNAQLATYVLSLVVLDAVERLGVEPAVAAGHSLGEYTALTAAGALELRRRRAPRRRARRGDAGRRRANARGRWPPCSASTTTRSTIACVRAAADVWAANYNAPGNVVIAGDPEAIEAAGAAWPRSSARRRCCRSPVGGAFHTPFMAPARERLAKALGRRRAPRRSTSPSSPTSTPSPTTTPSEWRGLLTAQLCSPVRWRQTLHTLADARRRARSSSSARARCSPARSSARSRAPRPSRSTTPDDLDTLLERIEGTPAAAHHEGEHLFMTERVVVSPAAGLFAPVAELGAGAPDRGRRPARHGRRRRGALAVLRAASKACSPTSASGSCRASRSPGCAPHDAPRTDGRRDAASAGVGHALPDKVVTNADLERDARHERRVDRRAQRHPRAPHRRHDSAWRSSRPDAPPCKRRRRHRPTIDLLVLATTHARPAACRRPRRPCSTSSGCTCGAFDLNAACSGFVYGLVVAAPARRERRRPRARHRRRDDVAHHRLGRPRHRRALRRRRGAVVLEAPSTGPAQPARLGPRLPTARLRTILDADIGGYIQMDGKEVFRQAVRVDGRLGPARDGAGRRDRRRHRACRAAPGEHPHHRVRLRQARHPDGAHRHRARPHRQHVVGVDPARAGRRRRRRPGARTATSCCSSASAPA